ncbi:MAG: DinB family protein [Gemmatimonadetes bacterium]|jgi:hypothetical protein|nr:DinB family protein [Gemmatimonadota bacterium]
MSIYTNPASASKEDAEAYTRALLELLGSQDPLAVLQDTPAAARQLARDLTPGELRTPEAEGKWCAAEVLQHLADSELVWGYRLRRILTEDRPALHGYDQDRWASRLRYADTDVEQALEMFGALRVANLSLLEGATGADLERCGEHEERGSESIAQMMRLYAGHDLAHRRQLARIRTALRDG